MIEKPRKHHFVPQFWIRRFADEDGNIWAYDHKNGEIRARSSKQLMQLFNLYTVQPSGIDDTSLETIDLNKIDSEGSSVVDRILNGDCTQSVKEEFASFLAAQVLRDPEVVASYYLKAQELTLSLLNVFDASDFDTFSREWRTQFPGASITEAEFSYIKSLGLQNGENALELIITGLETSEGLPELPFTDVVRSPDSQRIIRERILRFDWTLKLDAAGRFILGDAGVLYERGAMQSLSAPLSRGAALYLTPSDNPQPVIVSAVASDHDVTNLNFESAARSRRWIVGERAGLGQYGLQVGSRPLP